MKIGWLFEHVLSFPFELDKQWQFSIYLEKLYVLEID